MRSRSSPPISTGSGSGKSANENVGPCHYQAAKMKSGSRASLLAASSSSGSSSRKDAKNGYNTTKSLNNESSQLKRFKSLPSGKINRRVKRKAPSPPKNVEPYKEHTTILSQKDGTNSELGSNNSLLQKHTDRHQKGKPNAKKEHQSQPSSLNLKSVVCSSNNLIDINQRVNIVNNNHVQVPNAQHEQENIP